MFFLQVSLLQDALNFPRNSVFDSATVSNSHNEKSNETSNTSIDSSLDNEPLIRMHVAK